MISRLKLRKALYSTMRPSLWRALLAGVAPTIEHLQALRSQSFRTVVDIGANRGQFVLFARLCNPNATIYAFEPLREPKEVLACLFAKDERVIINNVAIGSYAGSVPIHVASRDDSSSLFPLLSTQREIFGVETNHTEIVQMNRLADFLGPDALLAPALLKIDVQGSELEVLKGSTELLPLFDAVYVECSYVPLYEGQPLASEVVAWLSKSGFEVKGIFNQHADPTHGLIQADILFSRRTEKR